MKETITTVEDEIIVTYSIELSNALRLVKDIKRKMQQGEKTVYLTIDEAERSRGVDLEIGRDLLPIAQGAGFGAYCELAFKPDKQIDKETGEEIRVIGPDGKAIADGIISDMSR